jgi:hypothetical protein
VPGTVITTTSASITNRLDKRFIGIFYGTFVVDTRCMCSHRIELIQITSNHVFMPPAACSSIWQ